MMFLTGSIHFIATEIEAQQKLARYGAGCYRKGENGLYSVFFLSDFPRVDRQHPFTGSDGDIYVGCKKTNINSSAYRDYMVARDHR